jgi:hypothetical protein
MSSWSTTLILSDVAAVDTAFCFSDDEASQFYTLEECYHFLSDDECVCVHFWLAPNLFKEQIQSCVHPFLVNPF